MFTLTYVVFKRIYILSSLQLGHSVVNSVLLNVTEQVAGAVGTAEFLVAKYLQVMCQL